jgi:aryl-alcohol dehydrogenase-like predicted oxidoreductase
MKNKKRVDGYTLNRRRFLGGSLAALAGSGLAGAGKAFAEQESPAKPTIKAFRTLGRTGFKVSDVGFGSGELAEGALLEAILDSGVNYIDTAESYGRGRSERVIGGVMKKRDRTSVFISTKMGVRDRDTKQTVIDRANKCLERLQMEYVDCLMMHMPSTRESLNNPAYHEAFAELKSQGKVRFSGLSNHGPQWGEVPETMEQVCLAAVEDGRFDVMLFVYNFLQRDMGENILKAAAQKGVGTTLMKTNPVLNYMEIKEEIDASVEAGTEPQARAVRLMERLKDRADRAQPFRDRYGLDTPEKVKRAAIKFVLDNSNVNTACPTIKNFSDLELYVGLSGRRFDLEDRKTLALYEGAYGDLYCRHACGLCEASCPQDVPVNSIMRYHHYFRAQGREKTAMVKYAAMEGYNASRCAGCSAPCEGACPHSLPVRDLLSLAHRTLVLG